MYYDDPLRFDYALDDRDDSDWQVRNEQDAWIDWSGPVSDREAYLLRRISQLKSDKLRTKAMIYAAKARYRAMKEDINGCEEELFKMRASRAPVQRLNDDVLALIFEHGAEEMIVPIPKNGGTYLSWVKTCSSVCRTWHRVVYRTPSLWSDLVLRVGWSAPKYILRFWGRHPSLFSSRLTLTIEMDHWDFGDDEDGAQCVFESVDNTSKFLSQCSERIRALTYIGCWYYASSFVGRDSTLPHLQSLTWVHKPCVMSSHHSVMDTTLDMGPGMCPRRLHFLDEANWNPKTSPPRHILLLGSTPPTTIRQLTLTTADINVETFRLLTRSLPALEELDLNDVVLQGNSQLVDSSTISSSPSTVLPLRKLVISVKRGSSLLIQELSLLDLPKLYTLHLSRGEFIREPEDELFQMVQAKCLYQQSLRKVTIDIFLPVALNMLNLLRRPGLAPLRQLKLVVRDHWLHGESYAAGTLFQGTPHYAKATYDTEAVLLEEMLRYRWAEMSTENDDARIEVAPRPTADTMLRLWDEGVSLWIPWYSRGIRNTPTWIQATPENVAKILGDAKYGRRLTNV